MNEREVFKNDSNEKLEKKLNNNIEFLTTLQKKEYVFEENRKETVIQKAREIIEILNQIGEKRKIEDLKSIKFPKKLKKKLIKKTGGCLACGQGEMASGSRHQNPIELHHIIPKMYGGDDDKKNALVVCKKCHLDMHN